MSILPYPPEMGALVAHIKIVTENCGVLNLGPHPGA